jgi:hypothetical protein
MDGARRPGHAGAETGNGMTGHIVRPEPVPRLLPAPQQCLQAEFKVGSGEHGLDRGAGELIGGGQHVAVAWRNCATAAS